MSSSKSSTETEKQMFQSTDYRQYQLERINPLIKTLGLFATLVLLLLLPWDYLNDSPLRNLAMSCRMLSVLFLYLLALCIQHQWFTKQLVNVLMLLGLLSFMALTLNYILLPDHTPYLYSVLYFFSLGFLVLAPLASTLHLWLAILIPIVLVYAILLVFNMADTMLLPFTLHSLPMLIVLNMAAWYIRSAAINNYSLFTQNMALASHDSLTGLLNRRVWDIRASAMFAKARREQSSFAVIMTDIDFFKKVNDTYGHQAGDYVLKAVARNLTSSVREYDVLARYGGEEFIVAVAHLTTEQFISLGERLRKSIEAMEITLKHGEAIKVTTSVGIAILQQHQDIWSLIDASDKALYAAKDQGRNRVVVASENLNAADNRSDAGSVSSTATNIPQASEPLTRAARSS